MEYRRGFTLVELLVVIVIIGVLAGVAVGKFSNTKGRAYVASMKADLHNLVTSQESYVSDSDAYYAGSVPDGAFQYAPSAGVAITIVNATANGWAATSAHSASVETCAVFVGTASAPSPATVEGQVACS